MHLVVCTERHFQEIPDGIFCAGTESYTFFERYLEVFERVQVVARVQRVSALEAPNLRRADGPGVDFLRLPDFAGGRGLAQTLPQVAPLLWRIAGQPSSVFVLRVPGAVSTLLWSSVVAQRRTFGLEVVTDPAEAYVANTFGLVQAFVMRASALSILRMQCQTAAAVAYVTRRELQQRYPARSRATFSYSSIDLAPEVLERAPAVQRRLATQPDRLVAPRLIFVGELSRPFKGLDLLIRAMPAVRRRHPGASLSVIGDGDLRPYYEDLAAADGGADAVEFLGTLPPGEAVFDAITRHDLFVLPSRREGLPRVLIESMAVGVPCVSTAVSGAAELMAAEDIVPKEDIDALAAKIHELCGSRQRRVDASSRNLETVRGHTRPVLQAARNRFYKTLADVEASRAAGRDGESR